MLFDPGAVEAIRDLTPAWLVVVLTLLSFFGSTYYQVPMLVGVLLLETKERIATWLGIVAGSYSLRALLKHSNDMERPPVDPPLDPQLFPELIRPVYTHPAEISTTAFPSGHVIAATVLWGLIVVDTDIGSRRQRLAVAFSVVGIVGISRVVLGAHYLGDILAGAVFGLAFLGIGLAVRERSARPVRATFLVAAGISTLVLSMTPSTTGSMILGGSLGVLLVIHLPTVQGALRHTSNHFVVTSGGILFLVTLGAIQLLYVDFVLLSLGMMAGAAIFWLAAHPIVRSLGPEKDIIT